MAKGLSENQIKALRVFAEPGFHARPDFVTAGEVGGLVRRGLIANEGWDYAPYSILDAGRAALAAAAPTPPPTADAGAWVPAEFVYRTTARPAWRGETVPADGFLRSYSANHKVWATADCVVYDRPLSANEQSRYELVPVSENAYAFAVGERVIYTETDEDYTVSEHVDGRYHLTHENGVRVEYVREDKIADASSEPAAAAQPDNAGAVTDDYAEDDAQVDAIIEQMITERPNAGVQTLPLVNGVIVTPLEEKDAEIARLRRELADAQAAVARRDAFERDEKQLAIIQQVKDERLSELMDETDKLVAALESISPMEGLTRLLSFRRFYNEFVQELHRAEASTDAAMIAALKERDNGKRTKAADVLALFADDDGGTIA